MRLLSYRTEGSVRCALVRGEAVIDLQSGLAAIGVEAEPGIRSFLDRADWRELGVRLQRADINGAVMLPLADLDLAPLVPDPRKIIFVAANTKSHLKEAAPFTNAQAPKRPAVVAKTVNAINGPYDPILRPAVASSIDYEAELCVVIGTRARDVPKSSVEEIVAGYTVANDVSDREYQLSSWEDNTFYRNHFFGKSFDGFCPCGPQLVTRDEFDDFEHTRVRCLVNGEVKQDDDLTDLIYSVEDVVSYLSRGITLEPGDLILMGAPAGVAHFLTPPPYLQPGDVVRCEIDNIGYIENAIVSPSP